MGKHEAIRGQSALRIEYAQVRAGIEAMIGRCASVRKAIGHSGRKVLQEVPLCRYTHGIGRAVPGSANDASTACKYFLGPPSGIGWRNVHAARRGCNHSHLFKH
jgi:hypothetical protein